jgi:hypothetical protein
MVTFGRNSTIERIESHAFFGTDIKECVLPKSVKYVDAMSFRKTVIKFEGEVANFAIHRSIIYSLSDDKPTCWLVKSMKTISNESNRRICLQKQIAFLGGEYTLTQIGNNSFYESKDLKTISIPCTVEEIGQSAFVNCKNLTKVVFEQPSQLKRILTAAFALTGIEKIKIPKTLQIIGEQAFAECRSLISVNFEMDSELKEIGPLAFNNCRQTREVIIPASVERVENNSFKGMYIATITFEKGSKLK